MKDRVKENQIIIMELINKKYPNLDIYELGFMMITLGGLRAILGHNKAKDTFKDYTHVKCFKSIPKKVIESIEFLEREIFGITKSRLDIDSFKTGNKTKILPDSKYLEIKEKTINKDS